MVPLFLLLAGAGSACERRSGLRLFFLIILSSRGLLSLTWGSETKNGSALTHTPPTKQSPPWPHAYPRVGTWRAGGVMARRGWVLRLLLEEPAL